MTTPQQHIDESFKTTADSLVNLYEIRLSTSPTILRFKDFETLEWQGYLWEGGIPIKLSGEGKSADPEELRPKLTIGNPGGVFTPYIWAGDMELATIIRKQVLYQNLLDDVGIYEQRMWRVFRVVEMITGRGVVTFELRNMSEGISHMIPVRQFIPPEFPQVSLQ